MAGFLKCSRFFRLSSFNITQTRFNCTRKGLVIGVYSEKDKQGFQLSPNAAKYDQHVEGKICESLQFVDGHLDPGKAFVFWDPEPSYTAVAVVSLGKKYEKVNYQDGIDEQKEAVRRATSAGCRALQNVGINSIMVDDMGDAEAAGEGSTLGVWKFQECKTKKQPPTEVALLTLNTWNNLREGNEWNYGVCKANAQNLARRLTDMPSNLMTPSIFAENIESIFQHLDVCVDIHDEDWIKEKCMNSFLAVTKGSCEPPKFIELSYSQGNEQERPIVLVGKGVTFDTGGISLKPSKAMDEMRGDMGGAATCLAALECIAKCCINVNVRVLLPLCENMPSGNATKPGDIVKAMNGKTICVNNTDAEGRLILADALCYAAGFDPKMIMSIATLTGAMRVALGDGGTGVFSTSDEVYKNLEQAGIYAGDRVWRFPFWKQYTSEITKQPGYDVNNIGKGVGGGACVAAAFLKEFVPQCVDYLHLDIAGVCGPSSDIPYLHKGMTGRPTRTLIEFIRKYSK